MSKAFHESIAFRGRSFAICLGLLFGPLLVQWRPEALMAQLGCALGLLSVGGFVFVVARKAEKQRSRNFVQAACLLYSVVLSTAAVFLRPATFSHTVHFLLTALVCAGALFLSRVWLIAHVSVFVLAYSRLVMMGGSGEPATKLWLELTASLVIGGILHYAQNKLVEENNELALKEESRYDFYSNAVEKAVQSERRAKRLTNASREALVVHGEGRILDANAAALALFGFTENELIGRPVTDLLAQGSIRFATEISDLANISFNRIQIVRKDRTELEVMAFNHVLFSPEDTVSVLGIRQIDWRSNYDSHYADEPHSNLNVPLWRRS